MGHSLERAGDQPGHALGITERDLPGNELTDDQGEKRDDGHHPAKGNGSGPRRQRGEARQPDRDLIGHGRTTISARQDAAQRNAHLDGGLKARRLGPEFERRLGSLIAFARELLQPSPPGGNHRNLRHG